MRLTILSANLKHRSQSLISLTGIGSCYVPFPCTDSLNKYIDNNTKLSLIFQVTTYEILLFLSYFLFIYLFISINPPFYPLASACTCPQKAEIKGINSCSRRMQPGFGKHKRMEWEKSVWMKVEIRDPKLNVTLAVLYWTNPLMDFYQLLLSGVKHTQTSKATRK